MSNRMPLRRSITEAWQSVIEKDYNPGRINSERSLQAALWSRLSRRLPAKSRRMFIEPRLSLLAAPGEARCPDIAICNTRQVIGIIELKYQPRVLPTWQKDVATFRWIEAHRERLSVSNLRYLGDRGDVREYGFAPNILYVWAGVHVACELDLAASEEAADLQLLALHAETVAGAGAKCR